MCVVHLKLDHYIGEVIRLYSYVMPLTSWLEVTNYRQLPHLFFPC